MVVVEILGATAQKSVAPGFVHPWLRVHVVQHTWKLGVKISFVFHGILGGYFQMFGIFPSLDTSEVRPNYMFVKLSNRNSTTITQGPTANVADRSGRAV